MKPDVCGRLSRRVAFGEPDKVFASAVHKMQALLIVECEHRHAHGVKHMLQRAGRLCGIEPLPAQQLLQCIDLVERQGQRVVRTGTASAHGVVALPHRCQEVRDDAQRPVQARLQNESEHDPRAGEAQCDGPANGGAVVRDPQQDDGGPDAWRAGEKHPGKRRVGSPSAATSHREGGSDAVRASGREPRG